MSVQGADVKTGNKEKPKHTVDNVVPECESSGTTGVGPTSSSEEDIVVGECHEISVASKESDPVVVAITAG
jgi:hypothetical protein